MLKKQVMKPLYLDRLEALHRRLSDASPKKPRIEELLHRHQAGFQGEKSLLFQFSYLPKHWFIFHDLRLYDGVHYFQIDFLIITGDALLLLEVKNLAGKLIFDGTRQLIQERETGTRGDDSPIAQANRHEKQLTQWLTLHHLPLLPITSLIVLTNKSSYFETTHPHVLRSNMLAEHLPPEMNPPISPEVRASMTKSLLQSHHPLLTNPIDRYDIDPSHIRPGVICPECQRLMDRVYGTWNCSCGRRDKYDHHAALLDYTLLKSETISSQEAADFLRLTSADTARRLLLADHCRKIGQGNETRYTIRTSLT